MARQSAISHSAANMSALFTHSLDCFSAPSKNMAVLRHFYELARPLLHYERPLGPTPTKGTVQRLFWSRSTVPFCIWSLAGLRADQLLKLPALEHFHHDVGPPDELALDVELRDRRPIGIFLDALTDLGVL